MKNFKKVIVFIVIFVLSNFAIYVYPFHKFYQVYNKEQNFYTYTTSPIYGHFENIINSKDKIDQKYIEDVANIIENYHDYSTYERDNLYKILFYTTAISAFFIGFIGFAILKIFKNKKYIAFAFIMSSIVSICFLCYFSYEIYISRLN